MKENKKRFTNLIIVDASGSMEPKATEVIGGLKQLFADVRKDAAANPEVKTRTIVVDFSKSKDFNVLVNTKKVEELTDTIAENYKVRGMTALFDAIGAAFQLVKSNQDGVFVTILTDGLENDSKEFTQAQISELIKEKKALGWVITFMGTTEAAIENAVSLGVSRGNTMSFVDTGAGVHTAFEASNNTRNLYYSAVVTSTTQDLDLENLLVDEEKTAE